MQIDIGTVKDKGYIFYTSVQTVQKWKLEEVHNIPVLNLRNRFTLKFGRWRYKHIILASNSY